MKHLTAPPGAPSLWRGLGVLALLALFFAVGCYRLGAPDWPTFDEIYHVRTAMEFWLGVRPFEVTHPPLAKLVMAAAMQLQQAPLDFTVSKATGQPAFAWRLPSLIAATAALGFQFLLARRLLGSYGWALIATALLALDGVFFACARIGMTNAYELCFMLLAVWAFVRYQQDRGVGNLFLMGLGLGLALATRWTAIYLTLLLGTALLVTVWGRERLEWGAVAAPEDRTEEEKLFSAWQRMNKLACARWLLAAVGALVLTPLALYALSFVPMVLQGNGPWWVKLTQWNYDAHGWGDVLKQQFDMLGFHATLKGQHPYASAWWSWPLMLRPTWFSFCITQPADTIQGILAVGNGLIWWASLPVMIAGAVLYKRIRSPQLGLTVFMAAGMWLLWALQPRSILHMHYMLESIPFVCIGIAYFWRLSWEAGKRKRVALHAALVLGWAIFFYPLLSFVPMSRAWVYAHMIFGKGWL